MAGDRPYLIAHRGERADYPENTRQALTAALDAGADGVEFDIQFTADGEPVVLHDRDLRRTGGYGAFIDELRAADVASGLPAHEPGRFGERWRGACVPTLADAVAAIADHQGPPARVFAEVKHESIAPGTVNQAASRVLAACAPVAERLVIIGFDVGVLRAARALGAGPIGWVVRPGSTLQREHARVLQPEFLFADRADVTAGAASLWPGGWRWVVYEVNDPGEARRLHAAGVWGVETASVARLAGDQ